MGDFRKIGGKRFSSKREGGYNDRGPARPTFAGKNWRAEGDRDRNPVASYRATCAKCGSPCEVPFRPISGRPIYCHNCFQAQKDGGDSRGGDRFPRRDYNINKTFDKSDFRNNAAGGNSSGLKEQMEMLNVKMDRLIKAVEAMTDIKPMAPEEETRGEAIAAPIAEVRKIRKPAKKVYKKNVRPF